MAAVDATLEEIENILTRYQWGDVSYQLVFLSIFDYLFQILIIDAIILHFSEMDAVSGELSPAFMNSGSWLAILRYHNLGFPA